MNRKSDISILLESSVRDASRYFLRALVEKKIQENGIYNEKLVDEITDHLLSKGGHNFVWGDESDSAARDIKIAFTKEDADHLADSVNKFLNKDLPKVVEKCVAHGAKLAVKSFRQQWPEIKVDARNELRHFTDRLDLRWAAALDPLRMLLIASRELGESFAGRLARSKAKKGLEKRRAISVLHARACQTAFEIVTLLENGLADGAYARWRTLYEISVVASVVNRFGDDAAARYLAHDAVSIREFVVNEYKYHGKVYDPKTLSGDEKEIERNYQNVIALFGPKFAGPYGWAANALNIGSPRFQDLEKAVNWKALSPDYKLSSYKIHAGVAGTIRSFSHIGEFQYVIAGATNAGLERPAVNTAYSLLHVTSLVFNNISDIEMQIEMRSLIILRDIVEIEAKKAAAQLEKEEISMQNEILK